MGESVAQRDNTDFFSTSQNQQTDRKVNPSLESQNDKILINSSISIIRALLEPLVISLQKIELLSRMPDVPLPRAMRNRTFKVNNG